MSWSSGIKANAPTLSVWENLHKTRIGNPRSAGGATVRPDCKICNEPCVINGIRLDCGHLFHYTCFLKLTRDGISKGARGARCPLCRTMMGEEPPKLKSPKKKTFSDKRSDPKNLKWDMYKLGKEDQTKQGWSREYGKKFPSGRRVHRSIEKKLKTKEFLDHRPVGNRTGHKGRLKKKQTYIAHHVNFNRLGKKSKHELKKSTIKPTLMGKDALKKLRQQSQARMNKVRGMPSRQFTIPMEAIRDPWRNDKARKGGGAAASGSS